MSEIFETYCKEYFNRLAGGISVNQKYYLMQQNDWFWLSYPQDLFASNWNQIESRYFRLHVDPLVEPYVNPLTLDEADHFVEAMCDTLGITDGQLSDIADEKIEYYYCANDTVVQKLTGQLTKGMVFLPTNDIISAVLPHCHEITHLLMNIKLKNLPLQTLPLLREGVAVGHARVPRGTFR